MANSKLYQKANFKLPASVIDAIKAAASANPNAVGIERAMNLIKNPTVSYALAKKIKNFFDNVKGYEEKQITYVLYGGDEMKNWLENILGSARQNIVRSKTIKSNAGFDNQFKKEFERNDMKPALMNMSHFKPAKTKRMELFEEFAQEEAPTIAAISIIFNNEGKFLIVKRSDNDVWMPSKWALVGGGIEVGESPEEALGREVHEETNLEVSNVIFCFVTKEEGKAVYVFLGKCEEPTLIKLNPEEHSEFAWVHLSELPNYETVPDVGTYVVKCLEEFKRIKATIE